MISINICRCYFFLLIFYKNKAHYDVINIHIDQMGVGNHSSHGSRPLRTRVGDQCEYGAEPCSSLKTHKILHGYIYI